MVYIRLLTLILKLITQIINYWFFNECEFAISYSYVVYDYVHLKTRTTVVLQYNTSCGCFGLLSKYLPIGIS